MKRDNALADAPSPDRSTVLLRAAELLDDEAEVLLTSQSLPDGLTEWPARPSASAFEIADGQLFTDMRTTARALRDLAEKEAPL